MPPAWTCDSKDTGTELQVSDRSIFYSSRECSSQSCHYQLEHRKVRDQIWLVPKHNMQPHKFYKVVSWLDPAMIILMLGKKMTSRKSPF